ncbi:hypothetical protein EV368DRAFT_79763 [Lentinula lateritia]|nr:hypothetical protein EV368DRAFT_79763 [Lentinula lateritia]
MARRRTLFVLLSVLGLFLVGTVVVLSSITYYLSIDPSHYGRNFHLTLRNVREYLLWTDDSSREFIAEHYPRFLDTFNDYKYAIQRADAIRSFVPHHYGGVYLDLDVGCLCPLDSLLVYPVILPKTIPVGVSNDLMFAEKGHPFLAQTIHNLVAFDHNWILNYPTVTFSTGPMFLSAQYGIYTSSHAGAQGEHAHKNNAPVRGQLKYGFRQMSALLSSDTHVRQFNRHT